MSQMKSALAKEATLGDAAVDGLLAGLGAGFVMAIYFMIAGLAAGDMPTIVFSRFDPSTPASTLAGVLIHFAVAGVYGVVFGTAYHFIHSRFAPVWLVGLGYGLVLLWLAEAVILPGSRSPLLAMSVWSFGLAHGIYGATLGWLVGRVEPNSR